MKTYDIYAKVVSGKYVGSVKADSPEEAVSKGWDHKHCYVRVCHQCSEHFEDAEITELVAEESTDNG